MMRIKSLLLIAVILATSFAATCSKNDLATYASDVTFSLRAAQPLINQFLPKASSQIAQGLDIAEKLKDAIVSSQSTTAVGYMEDLIPIFQAIVRDNIPQIHDPNVRTQIMAALALADIGLHFLVNHLQKNSSGAEMMAQSKHSIAEFAKEPVWGKAYRASKK
jgi:hypothetical protein